MDKKSIVRILIIAVVVAGILFFLDRAGLRPKGDQKEADQRNVAMLSSNNGVEISEQDGVNYYGDAKGFYAAPAAMGAYPGVVMIHEWWGLNDHIKDMARQLARQGYQVLAVDMYNGEVAADSSRAGQLAGSVRGNVPEANKNLQAAVDYLREQKAARVASLGWCFGGGQSLNLALSGEQLDATVIYYGNITSDKEQLAKIEWPVLGIFGEKDTGIPADSVREFDRALDDLGVENDINIYPNVGHAFANPSGMNYAPEETKDAWAKTLQFLKDNLK